MRSNLLIMMVLVGCGDDTTLADSGADSAAPDGTVACENDGFEPNDDESNATMFTGSEAGGVLCEGEVGDWFVFDLAEPDIGATILLTGPIGGSQRIRLLREGGELVDESLGGVPLRVSAPPGNLGRYFVSVDGCCAARVEYNLSIGMFSP